MKIVVCIPARYASTRFPAKVLARDTGKYLIEHTWEQARKARLPQRVVIAADDERIVQAAHEFGAECILTSQNHQSGTDRIAEAVGNSDADIIINVQGDEPRIDPDHIDYLAQLLLDNPDASMATLAAPFAAREQIADPNVVKVVVSLCMRPVGATPRGCPPSAVQAQGSCVEGVPPSNRGQDARDTSAPAQNAERSTRDVPARAIYFSRSVIPYDRERAGVGDASHYLRHIGIYAYRREFLLTITSLPQTPLEKLEKLEQLRALENGYTILVGKVERTHEGIDTPEQYAAFVRRYKGQA